MCFAEGIGHRDRRHGVKERKKDMNGLKTAALMGLLTGLILLIGNLMGGVRGMALAFGIACVTNLVSYWFSDRIVLSMYRAQPVEREQSPELYDMLRDLTMRMSMPMPKLFIIPTEAPNAFATGRSPEHASVAVTQGILRLLNREELQGVLAHELSHVVNRDILISSVAATLAGAIILIARIAQFGLYFGGIGGSSRRGGNPIGMLLTIILAPIAAMIIQLAISRSREYQADESGVRMLGGQAHGLASALQKLGIASQRAPMVAEPTSAHLFIVKPFTGRSMMQLFSTHPPMEKRIERLHEVFGNF